jgi:hypothetical protein
MVQPATTLEEVRQFFAELRRTGAHLGLDPEFSALESILTATGVEHALILRENLDRFFFGRAFTVLDRIKAKATSAGKTGIVEGVDRFRTAIDQLFAGQFVSYDNPQGFLPQSEMLREMLRLINENQPDQIFARIDTNIQHLEGHFFMILSEAMRNARSRGDSPQIQFTLQALVMIGRVVANARLKHNLPCNFAALWHA